MARQTVLVGKIGPAFGGGEIRSYGSATQVIHPEHFRSRTVRGAGWTRTVRREALYLLIDAIADNVESGAAYIEYACDYTPRTMGEVIGILS